MKFIIRYKDNCRIKNKDELVILGLLPQNRRIIIYIYIYYNKNKKGQTNGVEKLIEI